MPLSRRPAERVSFGGHGYAPPRNAFSRATEASCGTDQDAGPAPDQIDQLITLAALSTRVDRRHIGEIIYLRLSDDVVCTGLSSPEVGLHQWPLEKQGQEAWVRGQPVPSHVPIRAPTGAQAVAFGRKRPRDPAETDSLAEGDGFEPSVPRSPVSSVGAACRSCLRGGGSGLSAISSAPRTTPSSQAGARFEHVVACCAARRLPPAGGITHIYLRPALAQPAIR